MDIVRRPLEKWAYPDLIAVDCSMTMNLTADEPPESGQLRFSFQLAPISLQAKAAARGAITEAVRSRTRELSYLLDGYVFVEIDWHIHERFRWESDATADVDNIQKPLLDAFCGPEGVLIDDGQVKRISSAWFSTTSEEQHVDVSIEFIQDEWMPKAGLRFVRIKDALCYPVPGQLNRKRELLLWVGWLKSTVLARALLQGLSNSYYPARYVMPHGFFHRTRLNAFKVCEPHQLFTGKDK